MARDWVGGLAGMTRMERDKLLYVLMDRLFDDEQNSIVGWDQASAKFYWRSTGDDLLEELVHEDTNDELASILNGPDPWQGFEAPTPEELAAKLSQLKPGKAFVAGVGYRIIPDESAGDPPKPEAVQSNEWSPAWDKPPMTFLDQQIHAAQVEHGQLVAGRDGASRRGLLLMGFALGVLFVSILRMLIKGW